MGKLRSVPKEKEEVESSWSRESVLEKGQERPWTPLRP